MTRLGLSAVDFRLASFPLPCSVQPTVTLVTVSAISTALSESHRIRVQTVFGRRDSGSKSHASPFSTYQTSYPRPISSLKTFERLPSIELFRRLKSAAGSSEAALGAVGDRVLAGPAGQCRPSRSAIANSTIATTNIRGKAIAQLSFDVSVYFSRSRYQASASTAAMPVMEPKSFSLRAPKSTLVRPGGQSGCSPGSTF